MHTCRLWLWRESNHLYNGDRLRQARLAGFAEVCFYDCYLIDACESFFFFFPKIHWLEHIFKTNGKAVKDSERRQDAFSLLDSLFLFTSVGQGLFLIRHLKETINGKVLHVALKGRQLLLDKITLNEETLKRNVVASLDEVRTRTRKREKEEEGLDLTVNAFEGIFNRLSKEDDIQDKSKSTWRFRFNFVWPFCLGFCESANILTAI